MALRRRTATVLVTGATLLLPAAGPAQAATLDLEARMKPSAAFPRIHGHAEFDQEGGFREFDISIHQARRLAGRNVVVRVHGVLVGRMRVHADGFAHLDRHLGIPAMNAGDVVRVRTAGGTLVSRGLLRADTD